AVGETPYLDAPATAQGGQRVRRGPAAFLQAIERVRPVRRGDGGDFLDVEIIRLLFDFHGRKGEEKKARPRDAESKTVAQSALNPCGLSASSMRASCLALLLFVPQSSANARGFHDFFTHSFFQNSSEPAA